MAEEGIDCGGDEDPLLLLLLLLCNPPWYNEL
jgi:hypothetical protein